jgi:hypothetical protein
LERIGEWQLETLKRLAKERTHDKWGLKSCLSFYLSEHWYGNISLSQSVFFLMFYCSICCFEDGAKGVPTLRNDSHEAGKATVCKVHQSFLFAALSLICTSAHSKASKASRREDRYLLSRQPLRESASPPVGSFHELTQVHKVLSTSTATSRTARFIIDSSIASPDFAGTVRLNRIGNSHCGKPQKRRPQAHDRRSYRLYRTSLLNSYTLKQKAMQFIPP